MISRISEHQQYLCYNYPFSGDFGVTFRESKSYLNNFIWTKHPFSGGESYGAPAVNGSFKDSAKFAPPNFSPQKQRSTQKKSQNSPRLPQALAKAPQATRRRSNNDNCCVAILKVSKAKIQEPPEVTRLANRDSYNADMS